MRPKEVLSGLPSVVDMIHPDEPARAEVDSIVVGSPRRLRWVCEQGHSWETQVRSVAQKGTRCPYCANKRVLAGFNDLASQRPGVAAMWHHPLNGDLSPDQVMSGTPTKVWWHDSQCGHSWNAAIRQVVQGSRCAVCAGKQVDADTTSLGALLPDLVAWWAASNPETVYEIAARSTKTRAFVCPDGHAFQEKVQDLAERKKRCPLCSGRSLVPGVNSLDVTHPAEASEWDATRNGYPASEARWQDRATRYWACPTGHVYRMAPRTRIQSAGCPPCAGRAVLRGLNDFGTLHPHLLEQWDAEANEDDPHTLGSANVAVKPWWRCREGHRWQATVCDRVRGTDCPFCSGARPVPGVTDLATTRPGLAAQFSTRNQPLLATDVTATSARSLWWHGGACGHEWQQQVRYRETDACTVCEGRRATPGVNDVATTHPEVLTYLAADLSPVFDLTACVAGSGSIAWWRCPHGHTWRQSVRAFLGAQPDEKCPDCSGRRALAGVNDVATTHPDLVAEVDQSVHDGDVLTKYTAGSGKRLQWACAKRHTWRARIVDRIHHATGCPECSAASWTSRGEDDIAEYVKALGFQVRRGSRLDHNGRRWNYDIRIDPAKVLIEFNGLYFHSEACGRDETYHADKHAAAVARGWTLITVWEDDWQHRRTIVERMIAHKLGRSAEPRIHARSTVVTDISTREADTFMEANHIQGSTKASTRLALRDQHGDDVAVLLARYEGDTAVIHRYATSARVPGGFGRLLKALETRIATERPEVTRIKTFSDNLISDGSLYADLGFKHDGDVRPDYMYFRNRAGREHKFGYRRKRFETDPALRYDLALTERDLATLNGLRRIWDAGKKRWVKHL